MAGFQLSRRTMLKGLGVSVALPLLEAMLPKMAFGQQAAAARVFPRRMAFCYVPNGVNVQYWNPTSVSPDGRDFIMPKTMQPLIGFRDDLLIMNGLTCDKARANGDGPGDHARAMSAFLTGRQARKTDGANIRCGVSVDQLCAQQIGNRTRFPSLEIGAEGGRQAGGCDSGYSCAYSNNLSWRAESTPQPKETSPRAIFDRLFASANASESAANSQRRIAYSQSILDFVMEDAHNVTWRLGGNDQRRLDEYLSSLRDIERRIMAADTEAPRAPGMARPTGNPFDYRVHLRLLADLLVVAFQTDLTRISTFVLANEGSNRNYRIIDVPDGHHDVTHHQNNREKMEKVAKINRFHMEQFAYLIGCLKQIPEGEGTLLDNCMILYGSGNGDGNRHNHDELPIIMLGKGGGTINTGRHIRYPRNTPLTNLFIEMLDRMDVRVTSFGDSTGRLPNLT